MRIACLLSLVLLASATRADELLPPGKPIEEAIDHYIDARLVKENIAPAGPAAAENLLRRTMLDLVGRPPTMHESHAFAADPAADKRISLVDRLLASPAF